MGRLFLKLFILAVPFGALAAFYVCLDPFAIVWSYSRFEGGCIRPDRAYLSCEFYRRRRGRCNAYVFGNSRALGFRSRDWLTYLPRDATPFHFASTNDSLLGIARKVEYVDHLRDVLLVLDYASLIAAEDGQYGTPRLCPQLQLSPSPWRYQLNSARSYFSCYSLGLLVQSRFVFRPGKGQLSYDPDFNDIILQGLEDELARGEQAYYNARQVEFAPRPEVHWGSVLSTPRHFALLEGIQRRFEQQGARYKVVLAPCYDKIRLNPQDLAHLQRIFGAQRVYDFSGDHPLTRDPHYWYEPYHFRPSCGREILRQIYSRSATD